MQVEIQDGWHAKWTVVSPLLDGGPSVHVGRNDFASKPANVSREHLEFVLRGGVAFVKLIGKQASFLLPDGDTYWQLEQGVQKALTESSLVALGKSLDYIAKCMVMKPKKEVDSPRTHKRKREQETQSALLRITDRSGTEVGGRTWAGDFFFFQLADPQLGLASECKDSKKQRAFTNIASGDLRAEVRMLELAIEQINAYKPAFAIVCGDMVNAWPE